MGWAFRPGTRASFRRRSPGDCSSSAESGPFDDPEDAAGGSTDRDDCEARELTTSPGYRLSIDSLDPELHDYVAGFEGVTQKQARRDEIVHGTLNTVGLQIEKDLTAIMESAFEDGDAKAAYWAGTTQRSLLES